jgi:hypothetical protein
MPVAIDASTCGAGDHKERWCLVAKVLCIGDVHEPVSHPGYLAFCSDLYRSQRCNKVVFIGDIADWHAISFHAHHPEAPGPKDEYELAKSCIQKWNAAFPQATVCIGNHDERVYRLAESVNIPAYLIKDYTETWGTRRWEWVHDIIIDDVYYFHGINTAGMYPAFNSMKKQLMSVVQGHVHSAAGIKWLANPNRRIFGMDVGCGVDDKAVAFAYGKHQQQRSILGAGVVLDGIPFHHIMQIGPWGEVQPEKLSMSKRGYVPTWVIVSLFVISIICVILAGCASKVAIPEPSPGLFGGVKAAIASISATTSWVTSSRSSASEPGSRR